MRPSTKAEAHALYEAAVAESARLLEAVADEEATLDDYKAAVDVQIQRLRDFLWWDKNRMAS